jgi:VanZ family protein
MTEAARKQHNLLVIIWAVTAAAMAVVVVWAAMQVNDPLSTWINTDKMRHILGFSAIGLVAALMPSPSWRLRMLGVVLTFAMLVEIIQIPIPERTASLSDLFASFIGAFCGYGFGAALVTAFGLVRERAKQRGT